MVTYFCPYCGRQTVHLNISEAAASTQVTRRTVYNWLERSLVHGAHRPSGRRFICICSLVVPERFGRDQRTDELPIPPHLAHRPRRSHGPHA